MCMCTGVYVYVYCVYVYMCICAYVNIAEYNEVSLKQLEFNTSAILFLT